MKKLMSLFCALFVLGLTHSMAQNAPIAENTQVAVAAADVTAASERTLNNEVEVALADLPDAVKTALRSEDYQGWTVTKALLIQKDNTQLYKLMLSNGTEERKVKLDAEGKVYQHTDKKE